MQDSDEEQSIFRKSSTERAETKLSDQQVKKRASNVSSTQNIQSKGKKSLSDLIAGDPIMRLFDEHRGKGHGSGGKKQADKKPGKGHGRGKF